MPRVPLIRPSLLAGTLLLSASAAWAANGQVRQACLGDVKALCPGVKPGGGRIEACMRENIDRLSQGCREALSAARAQRQ